MKMNRTNTAGRILALLLTALMVLSLAACGTKGGDKMDGHSALGKGFHGGRQGHDHAGGRQKLW